MDLDGNLTVRVLRGSCRVKK